MDDWDVDENDDFGDIVQDKLRQIRTNIYNNSKEKDKFKKELFEKNVAKEYSELSRSISKHFWLVSICMVTICILLIVGYSIVNKDKKFDKTASMEAATAKTINDDDGYKTIADAFENMDWTTVSLMVKNGADVNVTDSSGGSVLGSAIFYDKPYIVQLMLEHGADPNSLDSKGDPVLIFALQCEAYDMAKMLVSHGADVNEIDREGNNALHYPIKYDDINMVEYLLDNGFLPESIGAEDYELAIHSNENVAELLLEENLQLVNVITEPNGWPLTHELQNSDNDELVIYLLEKGADINSQDADGNTLLHKYVRSFHYEMVNALMQMEADKSIKNNNGETPIDIIYNSNSIDDTVKSTIINILSYEGTNSSPIILGLQNTEVSYNQINDKSEEVLYDEKSQLETNEQEEIGVPTLQDGQDIFTYKDGSTYVGEWKNGVREGQGTWTNVSGDTYVGEWKNDMRNGKGTMTFSIESHPIGVLKYVGDWKNDKREGQGIETYYFQYDTNTYYFDLSYEQSMNPSIYGERYEGEFLYNERNGQGTLTYGYYGAQNIYNGQWSNNEYNGIGTITYSDGEKYVGSFSVGEYEGHGVYTYGDGSKYVGEWENSMREGHGTYTSSDGTVKNGKWADDEFLE